MTRRRLRRTWDRISTNSLVYFVLPTQGRYTIGRIRRIIIGVVGLLGAWHKHGRQTLRRVGAESCASFPAGFCLTADQSAETPSHTRNSQSRQRLASQPMPECAFPNHISKGLTCDQELLGVRYLRIY